ncbi:MAG: class I SAM-dependent methyltransferase [Bacteroidales bacterium]|nr:class I SAM-dependent methyltransferase [Bacteroidales bacterium]
MSEKVGWVYYTKGKLIYMGIEKQGSRPTGAMGKIIGRLMNKVHTGLYIDYFKNNLPPDHSRILDIGCGGGKFLKYLSTVNACYLLYGLDHSSEMVALSKKVNRKAIDQKRLEILQGSLSEIPLHDSSLDLITAFETVQFWPEIDKSLAGVYRLLKNGGSFVIINRYPAEGSKWWQMASLKSDKDYNCKLEASGFTKVDVDLDYKRGWIIVRTTK